MASGLKALEAWGHDRLDAGEPVDAVLTDILGPPGGCAAYLLVAIDVLISHFPKTRAALVPFLASPDLLAFERQRGAYDQMNSGLLTIGDEPSGRVRLADLRARPSRCVPLENLLHFYLTDDAPAKTLQDRLRAAVAALEPYGEHADFGDPSFMGHHALNIMDSANWKDVDGGRAYQSPAVEAAHLERLNARSNDLVRNSGIDARIHLAIDGAAEHATPGTARDAIEYAAGDLPYGAGTDELKSRSTRLIATAMLIARDCDDALLDAHEVWVREVIGRALSEEADRFSGSGDQLRFNRPALGTLALLHLWLRRVSQADRDTLIKIAVRRDRAGLPAFAAAREQIVVADPRLLKAAMRAAFSGFRRRRHPWAEDEAVRKGFEKERDAATEQAVSAEIAWLEGGDEPAWPAFPDERPNLRRPMRVPGHGDFADDDDIPDRGAGVTATVHIDHQSAAKWLSLLHGAGAERLDWGREIVMIYSDWTTKINGWGLPADVEVDRLPAEWNEEFYVLYAAVLMDASSARFDDQVKLVTDLPDQPFSKVAESLIHAADVLYFNNPSQALTRPVELRTRLSNRTMSLRRWKFNRSPGDLSIDYETGGVVAKLLLNTHGPFNGTRSYLVPAVADRLDPLLVPMLLLQSGGPVTFVALCTMNMLLVAPRARHLDFLLAAVESWFERVPADAGVWITVGIGGKVVEWLAAAIAEDVGVLGPTHPGRDRIDRVLGRLVAVGVAEAHELEKRVEQAAVADARTEH